MAMIRVLLLALAVTSPLTVRAVAPGARGPETVLVHNFLHLSVATWEPDVFAFLEERLRH
jgi:hypothetical protein